MNGSKDMRQQLERLRDHRFPDKQRSWALCPPNSVTAEDIDWLAEFSRDQRGRIPASSSRQEPTGLQSAPTNALTPKELLPHFGILSASDMSQWVAAGEEAKADSDLEEDVDEG